MERATTDAIEPESAREELPPVMSGSEILVASLERYGVDTIFAYPGGASMEMHQSLTRSKGIRVILPRHEQGGAFAAEGYARATGRPGVCMATSGPGATNLVTGIADAWMDSVPLVAITGQVPQAMIGKGAFQETDFFGMTLPVVKHSYLVTDIASIPRIVQEALHIASTGRPGPVVIDIPKNIQQATCRPVFPERPEIRGYRPRVEVGDGDIDRILELVARADRPLFYAGGGVISGGASEALRTFARECRIPVTTTIMGCGAFPESDPLSLHWLGMHGAAYANWAVSGEFRKVAGEDGRMRTEQIADGADLLLAFGVRFDDRVTGKVAKFCEHGTIVHVDIDASEHNKNRKVHLPITGDVRQVLERMLVRARQRPVDRPNGPWHEQLRRWKEKAPFRYRVNEEVVRSQHMIDHLEGREEEVILPQRAIEMLHELTGGEAILTTGVGQHQMWAGQYYRFDHPRRLLTSAGLGAMGFGYPAALGAKVACPERQVIDIDGDGSFLMNIQELATAKIERIAAKALVINNQHLGMVVQWEDRFYQGNRGHTYLGNPENMKAIYPDYVAMAKGFDVPCERVMFLRDLRPAMERMLESTEPYVLDVIVPYTEHVLPFIPANHTVADMIVP